MAGIGDNTCTTRAMKEVTSPSTWRSHEVEDLDRMSLAVFHESRNPEKWTECSIRRADHLAKQLGCKMPRSILELGEPNGAMTLHGRMTSFPEGEDGRSRLEMALTGLYMSRHGKIRCFVCEVQFRKPTSRTGGYVEMHQKLAPNCIQLKRCDCSGLRPLSAARRVRHNSSSIVDDLLVEEE